MATAAKKTTSAKKQAPPAKPDPAPAPATLVSELAREGTIQAKIAYVQTHVAAVEKTGQVDYQDQRGQRTNYRHMQEHALLELLRPFWRDVGICVTEGDIRVTRTGNHVQLEQELVIQDVNPRGDRPLEEWERRSWYVSEGVDKQDKASNKAHTGWMKYALQKAFKVPTEDIDDNDNSDPTEQEKHTPGKELISDQAATSLRDLIESAVTEGHLTRQRVKALLQGTYGVEMLTELSPEDGNAVATWVAEQVRGG